MPIPDFFKRQEEKKKNGKKNKKKNKGDFRVKCRAKLNRIKELSQERYEELNKVFASRYDKDNIQKKMILGFHGQLANEIAKLSSAAGPIFKAAVPMKKSVEVKKPKPTKKAEKKVEKKEAKTEKKVTKKAAAKTTTTKKKTAKKKAAKKTATKKTASKKKIVKKAATKKTTSKKKTAKKKTK